MNPTAVARPLPGPGLVVRAGDLLLVCADSGAGVEDLLGLVSEVAAAGGDGGALVRRVAAILAADFEDRYPACALSGPTADGRLAVLVHGAATADIVGGDGEISLSGTEAITSVNRLVAGPVTSIRLQLPGAGAANPRSRLDAGIVTAAGLVYSDPGAAAEPVAPEPAPRSLEPAMAAPEPAASEPAAPEPTPGTPPDTPEAAGPEPPPLRQPDPSAPFVAVLLVGERADEPQEPPAPVVDVRPRVLGVLCKNNHFNDPNLRYCAVCGISMAQQTLVKHEGPRPPLGVLLLDDGSTFRLDVDYVIGREPQQDPEVVAGTVRPLRVSDSDGVVSRRHARVALVGWDVHVIDLGSANGTYVQLPGDPQRHQLVANQHVAVQPGTQVTIGRRWFRYESHRNP